MENLIDALKQIADTDDCVIRGCADEESTADECRKCMAKVARLALSGYGIEV